MIIEPSRDLRLSFTTTLERRGLVVQAAASAQEALALPFAPDILIADYDLADELACEAIRELRRRHPGVVALLTSDAFSTKQTLGSITLLPKPSEPGALLDLLRRAVTADSLWYVRRGRVAS
jgi:CheY-like chemotaxis protein